MALLPLAGWATDYTGVVVTLSSSSATYTGGNQLPGVTVQYDVAGTPTDVPTTAYTATWNDGTADVDEAVNAKTYTLTIAAKGENTLTPAETGGLVKSFTIAKKLATVTIDATALAATSPTNYHRVYGWKPADFDGTVITTAKAALTAGEDFSDFVSSTDKTTALNNIVINWGPEEDDEYYAAGEHTFTLSFNSMPNYIVSLSPSTGKWYVDKKDLIISADATTTLTYGDVFDKTTASTHVTYTGFVDGEDENDLGGELGFISTYDAAVPTKSGVGTYSWSPSGKTSDNYNITYNNGIITVVAKSIAANDVTIDPFDNVTYNGYNQKPTAIKAGTFKDKTLAAADYTLEWYPGATIEEEVITDVTGDKITGDIKNAGTYYAKITGKGNYKGVVYKAFTIGQAKLGIRSANLTKVYAATNYYGTATTATYSGDNTTVILDGLKGTDTKADALSADPTLSLEKDGTPITDDNATDAGEYIIKLSLTGVTSTNYELQAFSVGKLTISKRVVKITAKDKSKKFGITDPYKVGVVATAADVTVATTPATEGILTTQEHAITAYPMLKREGDEAKGTYRLYLDKEDEDHKLVIKKGENDVTANYDPQFIDGEFTIGEGEIGIWADDQTATYGITVAEAKDMLTATIIGMDADDITQVQDAVNAKVVLNVPAGLADTDKLPANETGYSISFADFEAADVIPAAILANYSSDITKYSASAKFVVNKKPLEIEVHNQSLIADDTYGEGLPAASKETVTIITTGLTADDEKALFETAATKISLKFNSTALTATYVNGEGKLRTAATTRGWTGVAYSTKPDSLGVWEDCIEIDATNYNAATTVNYKLVVAGADATVTPGTLFATTFSAPVVFDIKAEDLDQITAQVNKKIDATISNTTNKRTLYANQWNALTLPFDITPFDFCGAIGTYAVFDVLQAGGNALNFKITINEIPAYTPFLVKVDKDVDLSGKKFNDVIIKAVDEDALTQSTSVSANWSIVGTVLKADVANPTWTIQPTDANGNIKLLLRENAWNYSAFTAYITTQDGSVPANAPVIYVEEPDGSTTAITAINAEGVAVAKDGWYTLNGVKLQGMPTEKGVYINNGKKVVLK